MRVRGIVIMLILTIMASVLGACVGRYAAEREIECFLSDFESRMST